jgi:drug/metabolite transporter (DMT)-like permease
MGVRSMLITILIVLMQTVAMTAGDLLLAKGMKQIGDIAVLDPTIFLSKIFLTLRNVWILTGVACLAVSLLLWLAVLSRAPLSLAVPMTAVAYVLNAFAAKYILLEAVSAMRWTATGVIALGVLLLIRS